MIVRLTSLLGATHFLSGSFGTILRPMSKGISDSEAFQEDRIRVQPFGDYM